MSARGILTTAAWCLGIALATARMAPGDVLGREEEEAFRAAVARVAPAVVRIEPATGSTAVIGGPAEAAAGIGPATGLVVGADGWVITTAFAVPQDAAQAVVVLSDGVRRGARAVGRDRARGLVLLKVEDVGRPLDVPEWAPAGELAVGQWTLALGRTWNAPTPSVAVGVLSATNRAWGRAVQTDAAVSPANYGGPLVDIAGRVIGILAPLPADTAGMVSGTELYDSGIGFAVPIEDVLRVLPKLQAGASLAPGVIGIGYAARDPFTSPATIATCRAGSPAAQAGLRAGDTIVAADGRPVTRIAELRHALAPRYAGDDVELVVERAGRGGATERVTAVVKLVESLPPWRRPVLGIVPVRTVAEPRGAAAAADGTAGDRAPARGVAVHWLWPDGPAARAGVLPGDVVESITAVAEGEAAGDPLAVDSAAALAGFVGGSDIGRPLRLAIRRGAETRTVDIAPVAQPADVPADVPVAAQGPEDVIIDRLEAPEIRRPPLVLLPAGDRAQPLGVLVFFAPPPGTVAEPDPLELRVLQAAVARHRVALVLPQSADPDRWGRDDIPTVARALDSLRSRRPIAAGRIAFAGRGAGAAFAWLAADALGQAVRGVALLEATLPRQAAVEPAEPGRSRWVLFAAPAGQPSAKLGGDRALLERNGFPVGLLPEAAAGSLPAETLCAWVESLGVL